MGGEYSRCQRSLCCRTFSSVWLSSFQRCLRRLTSLSGKDDLEARYEYIGRELHGKTLGILGFGRIGSAVGRIGHRGFDMKILYYDALRYEETEKEIEAEKVSLEDR